MSRPPGQSPAVAYAGGIAAHAAAACERLFPADARLQPLPTFDAVARAVTEGAVEYGVLAIESSLAGPIAETHDLMYAGSLSITAETAIPIRHCIVAKPGVELAEVRTLRSHPAAFDQCRRLLASLPSARPVASSTTAQAAEDVAQSSSPSEAAIASERAAATYGLEVIAADIGDHPNALTRFVALAPHTRIDRNGASWRMAFSFLTDHRSGALCAAIHPFALAGIDLVQLVSRPVPAQPWTSRFDAVLAGHPLDAATREALAEVRRRVRHLRIFGSYPAGA